MVVSRWSRRFEASPPMRGQYEAVPRSLAGKLVFGIGRWANRIEGLVEKLRRGRRRVRTLRPCFSECNKFSTSFEK
jgi:hypothetical protein